MRAVRVALVLVLVLSARASIVRANTFGAVTCDTSLDSQCVANNWAHYYYVVSLSAGLKSDSAWVSSNVYNPIQSISMSETTSTSTADIMLTEGSYGLNGYRAWTQCDTNATYGGSGVGRWCKAQLVKFNSGAYPSEYNSSAKRRFVVCHEVGHTLGLHHETASVGGCMHDLPLNYSGSYPSNLAQHDVYHIDNWY